MACHGKPTTLYLENSIPEKRPPIEAASGVCWNEGSLTAMDKIAQLFHSIVSVETASVMVLTDRDHRERVGEVHIFRRFHHSKIFGKRSPNSSDQFS